MSDPNLWKAAQACIEAHGDSAEAELRRLAMNKFTAGELEEAAVLFQVFQAVKHLRAAAALEGGPVH